MSIPDLSNGHGPAGGKGQPLLLRERQTLLVMEELLRHEVESSDDELRISINLKSFLSNQLSTEAVEQILLSLSKRLLLNLEEHSESSELMLALPSEVREGVIDLKISAMTPFFLMTLNDYKERAKLTVMSDQMSTSQAATYSNQLKVSYSEVTGEVILNGLFLLAALRATSDHTRLFSYLYRNPNRLVPVNELREKGILGSQESLEPADVIKALGFVGDLSKIFFKATKQDWQFFNPVTPNRLKQLRIPLVRLRTK